MKKFLVQEVKRWETLTSGGGHLYDDINVRRMSRINWKITHKRAVRSQLLAIKLIINVIFINTFKPVFFIFRDANLPKDHVIIISFHNLRLHFTVDKKLEV